MTTLVEFDVDDRVAILTLNRPDQLNAIVPELVWALRERIEQAQSHKRVRVLRLRGAGRSFCAGYDIGVGIEAMVRAEGDAPWDPIVDYQLMREFTDVYMSLWDSPKPVVAQVHGYCIGGGTDLALCSDITVASHDAQFGYPPARVWGSPTTSMWVYRLPPEHVKRLLLTGDCIDGRTAANWALVSESVDEAFLDAHAEALARRISLLPANQLAMMKMLINNAYDQMGMRSTQRLGLLLDGAARHTPEGVDFTARAGADLRQALADRDGPFGDYSQRRRSTP